LDFFFILCMLPKNKLVHNCVYISKQFERIFYVTHFEWFVFWIIFSNGHSLFTTVRYNFFDEVFNVWSCTQKWKVLYWKSWILVLLWLREGKRIIRFLYHLKLLNVQFQILPNLHQNVNTFWPIAVSFSFFTVEGSIIMYQPITGVEFNCLFYIWNCNLYVKMILGNLYLLSYVIVFDCKLGYICINSKN
jgi:hypothetical protein